MALHIDIVTSGTRGLQCDAEIVRRVLSTKHATQINSSRLRNGHLFHQRWLKRLGNRSTDVDRLLLFFEILPTSWMDLGKKKILIPNQEWMRDEVVRNLRQCEQIWCKTRYAEAIFRERGFDTRYIGFSSLDVYLPSVPKHYDKFIHVAGRSHLKGTRTILELWKRHTDWPSLLVITNNSAFKTYSAHNILVRPNNLPDDELHELMNHRGIHLCPSETEGFGHYIGEAMSTKAVVITVAAPPMNELVTQGNGLLAKYYKVEPMSFSERFFVDATDLERQIQRAIALSPQERSLMGEAARNAFNTRHANFENLILAAVDALTSH